MKNRIKFTFALFGSRVAIFRTECLKVWTKLDHFAPRSELYLKAVRSAFDELQKSGLRKVCRRPDFRNMLDTAADCGFTPEIVLFDSRYSGPESLKFIRSPEAKVRADKSIQDRRNRRRH